MAIDDVDQNGLQDIVIGNYVPAGSTAPSFTVLYNFSNDSFASVDSSFVYGVTQNSIQIAYMNNDTYPDIVSYYAVNYTEEQSARVFYNQNGVFNTYLDIPFTGDDYFNQFRTGDVNGDGLGDIIFYSYAWNYVSVFVSNGPYQYLPLYQSPLPFSPLDIAVGDVDSDGKDEIVFPYHPLLIFDYTETGWHQIISGDLNYYSSQVQLGDVDNDGIMEIVTRENPLTGNIYPIRIYKLVNGQIEILYQNQNIYPGALQVFDYNNDNLADYRLDEYLFTNIGNYNFIETTSNLPLISSISSIYVDMNNDGLLDIVLLHNGDIGCLIVYFGDGNGNFYDNPVATTDEFLPSQQYESIMIAYPNPMSSQINFRFIETTPRHSSKIHIYNVKGQLIWQTVVTDKQAVWNRIDKSGQRVAQGVYYCRIESIDKRVTAQKILVID
jgi:hypothetical protein